MTKRHFFAALIIIIIISGFILPGECTIWPDSYGLSRGSFAVYAADGISGQTGPPENSPSYDLAGSDDITNSDSSLSEIPPVNDYIAVGTILVLSFIAVLFILFFYYGRLKTSQAMLKKYCEEREAFSTEVAERLNNTFAVLSSLVSMQILNSNEEETKQKLIEIGNRIMAISLVHQNLLHSKGVSKVNVRDAFTGLGEQLIQTYFLAGDIDYIVKGEECYIGMAQAVPLGLVMNEIVSNSLKFAFAGRISGEISVEYKCSNGTFELCVCDDGVGIPEHRIHGSRESLGFNLINNIVSMQLKGSADLQSESGTKWIIHFPAECGLDL